MAVGAEPGFDQHYETEDTFGELRSLVERGFWLADLELTQAVRLRRQTFDAALGARASSAAWAAVRAPDQPHGRRAALPAHAGVARQGGGRAGRLPAPLGLRLLLGQPPYALDVAVECRGHGDDQGRGLVDLSVRRNRADARRGAWRLVEKVNVRNLRRFVSKSY